jgi:carboxyl-terminal processing protease
VSKKLIFLIVSLLLVLFVTGSFSAGFVLGGVVHGRNQLEPLDTIGDSGDFKLMQEIYGQLSHAYVDKLNQRKLVDGAIDGMIGALKDPYTKHLKKTDYKTFQEHTAGHFGGVGMELGMRDDRLTVVAPIKDTPAYKAGVEAGDLITKIDGRSTKDMAIEKAVKLIRGEPGTAVTLTFTRGEEKPFDKELIREEIKLPNVSGKVLDKNIAYIKLHAFNGETAADVRRELDELKEKGIKGVVIDLRNNPGGLLDEAVQVSSLFIKNGPIVKVKSRSGKTDTFTSSNDADDQLPLVLLVNKGSASASEIFAGAVQDADRGVIVGEKTFGKGSVQTVVPLTDGSGLVMTTAKYFTPSGRSLNKDGVEPDVKVKLKDEDYHQTTEDNDPQLNKAKEVIRDLLAGKKVKKAS